MDGYKSLYANAEVFDIPLYDSSLTILYCASFGGCSEDNLTRLNQFKMIQFSGIYLNYLDEWVSEDFLGFLDYYGYLTSKFIVNRTFVKFYLSMRMIYIDAQEMCDKDVEKSEKAIPEYCRILTELKAYELIFYTYNQGIEKTKEAVCTYIKKFKGAYYYN